MTPTTIIDTKMHGHERLTASFLVTGEKTALIETGPKSRVDTVLDSLQQLGVDHLDWIVVTHIHLDHAGAAGTLAARFPDAKIAVHPVGAPHLVDPSKLWSSATRIYGERMEELWGGIDPTPEQRIETLQDGDKIDLGGRVLQALETPGHASHHHAYVDDETGVLFAGDALGVRLPDIGAIRPATPPPEFHLPQALESIDKIRRSGAGSVWFTHFGPADRPVEQLCDEAAEALQRWADWVRTARKHTDDLDEVAALVRQQARDALEQELAEDTVAKLESATSYRMNTWGYMRYLEKNEAR